MYQGLHFTEAVMLRTLDQLTGISHNIANVNTTGYKAQHSFAEVIQSMDFSQQPALLNQMQTSFTQGLATSSSSPYHLMIDGDGFFMVTADDQSTLLTRKGDFRLDEFGSLVTSEGYTVAGEMGDIRISGDVTIDENGAVWSEDKVINQLQIVSANTQALTPKGAGYYTSAFPVYEADTEKFSIRQGMLESGNVDSAHEFTSLITAMRQFEMQQKVVRVYDQMIETGITTLGEF